MAAVSPVPERRCDWCRGDLETTRGRFCHQRCRQAAFRTRRQFLVETAAARPMRFAYADPPYPGFAKRYYQKPEVDHAELVQRLVLGGYDGWALSTSSKALVDVLPLCPREARVLAWVKPIGGSARCLALHSCWEPVIVMPGRRRRPGQRDWLRAMPARGGGDLMGRKPIAFCAWLFACLGMSPGDELDDLFPGTGIVGRTWRELSSGSAGDASLEPGGNGGRNENRRA